MSARTRHRWAPRTTAPPYTSPASGGGAVYVEALAGLDALPVRGAWFCFAPIKVRHGSGAPGRAFAFVPSG